MADDLDATLVDMRFVKPLDESLILDITKTHQYIATIEENSIQGGAGSAVSEFLSSQFIQIPILHLGIPDSFVDQGLRKNLLNQIGLSHPKMKRTITSWLKKIG